MTDEIESIFKKYDKYMFESLEFEVRKNNRIIGKFRGIDYFKAFLKAINITNANYTWFISPYGCFVINFEEERKEKFK